MKKLTKTEKKIRMRVGRRVKRIEEKVVPQHFLIRKFFDAWMTVEKFIRDKRYN